MPIRKPLIKETAKDRIVRDRVQRAKQQRSPIDRTSRYHERLAELAREHGLEPADAVEEWSERAAAREYLGGFNRDEAERLAYEDVLERFRCD